MAAMQAPCTAAEVVQISMLLQVATQAFCHARPCYASMLSWPALSCGHPAKPLTAHDKGGQGGGGVGNVLH
jgi:hypothetical protein